MKKLRKENEGFILLVGIFAAFFLIAWMAIMTEKLFWNPVGVPIGIA